MEIIKGLLVEPYKLPKEIEIDNTLEAKQELVGGLIEEVHIHGDNEVALICNEEGKIYGLPYNRDIGYDIIAGPFLIVGIDRENYKSLNEKQILKYKMRFDENSIIQTENKLMAIKLAHMKKKLEYER